MNVALWVIAGVLALVFGASGLMKLFLPKDKLVESGLGWATDYKDHQVKLIGGAELLGAVGVILPGVLRIAPVLVPVAAVGLAGVMVGAIIVHTRRREAPMVAINLVLLALALALAWGRFAPYSFTTA